MLLGEGRMNRASRYLVLSGSHESAHVPGTALLTLSPADATASLPCGCLNSAVPGALWRHAVPCVLLAIVAAMIAQPQHAVVAGLVHCLSLIMASKRCLVSIATTTTMIGGGAWRTASPRGLVAVRLAAFMSTLQGC
jgi:hypothetical protein